MSSGSDSDPGRPTPASGSADSLHAGPGAADNQHNDHNAATGHPPAGHHIVNPDLFDSVAPWEQIDAMTGGFEPRAEVDQTTEETT
jgi:hypothetical protein